MADKFAGLRVDVCTYQGLQQGLPRVLDVLAERKIHASIFPAMGPDRSGLAVLRIFRKRGFLQKMLRTGAASMYGFRTALYGTLLPAPLMGKRGQAVVRRARDEGHEVGIHAWDHVRWQDRLDSLSRAMIREDYERAIETYEKLLGCQPECTASPAWLASDVSLSVEETFRFRYASDVRGRGPFRPVVRGRVLALPQVPLTLPTLDEVLGRDGWTAEDFYREVLRGLTSGDGSVLTVHAEAEGRAYLRDFEALLERVAAAGWRLGPLSQLLPEDCGSLPTCPVPRGIVRGRAGAVSFQGSEIVTKTHP